MSGSTSTGRRRAESELSSKRVAAIVGAAEEAATRVRDEAEARASDRIAEGTRAANERVRAAEAEATDILAAAKSEADAERARGASEALATVGAAEEEAATTLENARAQARDLLADARSIADAARREGEQLTGHLGELSASLRANSERLMRDIRQTHETLSARLSSVDTGPAPRGSGRHAPRDRSAPADDLDVPEFIPGS
jgi:hypothetical protein